MYWIDFIFRIILALLFGTAIGAERQWRHKVADLRTNALVAVGAALYVTLSVLVVDEASPTRVAAQVVSGIGFLGAGVIIREGINVKGINTAATLWCAAAIGVLTGSGYYFQAFIGTLVVLIANIVLRSFQQKIDYEHLRSEKVDALCQMELVCDTDKEDRVRTLLTQKLLDKEYRLASISSKSLDLKEQQIQAEFLVPEGSQKELEKIIKMLRKEEGIKSLSWKLIPGGHEPGVVKSLWS